jgi:hypothetical protein
MTMPILRRFPLFLVLAATPAAAADGVIEINQVRAEAGGVTPGDEPGFPVTLSEPGSYRLTGNLDVRNTENPENTTAIDVPLAVSAFGVSIDLGGFAILGPVVCTHTPGSPPSTTCAPASGTGRGVAGAAFEVKNGTVMGMGSDGVRALHVENVTAYGNGGIGIDGGATVVRSRAMGNGSHGLGAPVLLDCFTQANGGNGAIASGVARGVVSFSNHEVGIHATNLVESVSDGNNRGFTIGGLLLHSVARGNADLGAVGIGGAYGWNVLTNNGGETQIFGSATEIGENLCGTNTTCP